MVSRKKRSISMPPELDSSIEAAAAEGTSYSGWLALIVHEKSGTSSEAMYRAA